MTEYAYAPVDSEDVNAPIDRSKPRTITEKVGGIVVSKTYRAYIVDPGTGERTEITERCADVTAGYGDASNLRTVRTYFASGTGLEVT